MSTGAVIEAVTAVADAWHRDPIRGLFGDLNRSEAQWQACRFITAVQTFDYALVVSCLTDIWEVDAHVLTTPTDDHDGPARCCAGDGCYDEIRDRGCDGYGECSDCDDLRRDHLDRTVLDAFDDLGREVGKGRDQVIRFLTAPVLAVAA